MSTITLIRHGQANTRAQDETSYDKLSELGTQQAAWLGDHLRATGEHFERVYSGTLTRHVETARAMQAETHGAIVQDARLNEMEFFTLANLLRDQQGIPLPDTREGFVTYMPMLLGKWQAGAIGDTPETFQDFETRVDAVINEINAGHGPALVVTSGGLIGMVMRHVMGLAIPAFAKACIAIQNTSVHRLHRVGDDLALTQFNAVPHLDHPDRQYAQTHL
ncbi:histidine phosphatase family protein [Thalassovita aquimarina]|uniref:Histidine phosphatase family protein n=1 Tax=Thalassovita aquimarina TaxID=2785917 RepID=A0ABS5HTZ5_9RHOB|nr:histidine phosphatase family protein [Thalassovita aquimarina]MBR9652346.1 histidine phosphatase family protein [Thalassovita aquimarina]